jgi:uncharacterized protein YoxC
MADQGPNKLVTEFITTADPKGAKDTAAAINEVKAAAAGATPAQQQLNQAGQEAAKTTEKVTTSKKGLRDIMQALRVEFPLFARGIDLIKGPYVALAAAVAMAWSWLKKWHEELDQAEARIQRIEKYNVAAARFSEHHAEAAQRAREHARAMREMADAYDSVASKVNELKEALSEQQRFQNESESEDMAAEIGAVEERTDLSPSQKSAAKKKIKDRYTESARVRQRDADWKMAEAYQGAANAESAKADLARFQLPGAIRATADAGTAADTAALLAEVAEDEFKAQSPGMLKKIRELQDKVSTAREHDIEVDPTKPGLAMGRAQAQRLLDQAKGEHKALVDSTAAAQANARNAKQNLAESVTTEEGYRRTIRESTAKGIEYGETSEKMARGVLRSAQRDPLAERSRPPGFVSGPAGADGLARAGGQMERASGDITRVMSGLDGAIGALTEAIQRLGAGGQIQELIRKMNTVAEDVKQLQSQGRHGR